MIRLTFVLRRRPELSREQFQDYWRRQHGPLVAKHSTRLGILRYVQVHTLDDAVNDQMAEARGGMEEPYDGVAELWWRSRERIVEDARRAGGPGCRRGAARGRAHVHRPRALAVVVRARVSAGEPGARGCGRA